jgi:autotransporter-associated beta strand protein
LLTDGGDGYAWREPRRIAPTLTVSGGSGTGLEVQLTLEETSDGCRPTWRIASLTFSGGTGYRYVPATPARWFSGPPAGGGGGGGGGGNTGGGAPANPGAGGPPTTGYIPAQPAQNQEALAVTCAAGDVTLAPARLIVTSNSSGVPTAVTIAAPGSYYGVDDEDETYVSAAAVGISLPPLSSLGGAALTATVDSDPDSPTFGEVTEITIDDEGTEYEEWEWPLLDYWFSGEGTCCGGEWRTEEGTCCSEIWYPAGEECPEGQVFINVGPDCCACFPETVFDPESEEMVSTLENPSLVAVLTCDSSCVMYSRFDSAQPEQEQVIGRCCAPGGSCSYTTEDECEGTWEEKCCVDAPQCPVACCSENDDGVSSCEVVPKEQCESPDIIDGGDADCETACKGACCVDGELVDVLSQEECDDAGGCWGGAGSEECVVAEPGLCRPPFTPNCCESVVSGASGLTFTQPRRKRCDGSEESDVRWLVSVVGSTDSEIRVHGSLVGQNATPSKRCPINMVFDLCWDKFNIEPMPCDTNFKRLDVSVCWTPEGDTSELLQYSGCNDITVWLGECTRDCETTMTYDGPGVNSTATFQIRGDATIEANGGALVLPGFNYSAACDLTLTLTGISTADNAVAAMANPASGFKKSIKKTGTGRWRLTAASTYTGLTEILSGTMIVATNAPLDGNGAFGYSLNGGLGGGSSPIVEMAGGATLLLDGAAQVGRIISITGNDRATLGGANISGTTRFQSVMTFFVNQDVLIQAASGGTVEFANGWLGGAAGNAGPVEGDFTFGSAGNLGLVLLSGNLSTNGAVRVEYGTLRVTGSVVAISGVTVAGSGAVLDYRGTVDLASPVSLVQGTLTGDATINTVAATGGTISVGSGEGIVIDTELSGSGTVAKTGTGTLVIAGTSTFAGTLNATAGTLDIGSTFGGTLNVSGGTLTGNATLDAVAVSNSPTFSVGSGDEIEIGGTLSGSGTLAKTGTGTLRIASTNTFSGTLNVSAGTVVTETIPTNPGGLATTATFTDTTLSVAFTADPTSGSQYVLLAGPTTQTYTPVLTGTAKTGTYNAATATLTIS